jgi:IS30 family transposase
MIRRKFPKGTNFDKVSKKAVECVEKWLNTYPRLILDWSTSSQWFEVMVEAV